MSNTLFITGATSGFGEACARRFAEAGWKLVLTGRREERLNALCAELSKQTEVHGLVLDVRDRKAMEAALRDMTETLERRVAERTQRREQVAMQQPIVPAVDAMAPAAAPAAQ